MILAERVSHERTLFRWRAVWRPARRFWHSKREGDVGVERMSPEGRGIRGGRQRKSARQRVCAFRANGLFSVGVPPGGRPSPLLAPEAPRRRSRPTDVARRPGAYLLSSFARRRISLSLTPGLVCSSPSPAEGTCPSSWTDRGKARDGEDGEDGGRSSGIVGFVNTAAASSRSAGGAIAGGGDDAACDAAAAASAARSRRA